MTEVMSNLYQIMVILYAISIMFYFVDYFYKKEIIRRTAFWLVSIVWILQTAFIVLGGWRLNDSLYYRFLKGFIFMLGYL